MRVAPLSAATLGQARVDAVLSEGATWLREHGPLVDLWRDASTRSVVAIDDDEVVGAARCFDGRIHPTRLHASAVVREDRRREGIGRSLVAALQQLRPDARPLAAPVTDGSAGSAFADALGAVAYQSGPPMRVPTAAAASLDPLAGGLRAVPGEAIPIEALEQAWVDLYLWQHIGWAPTAHDAAARLRDGFAEEIDLALTTAVLDDDGRIRAACLVWAGETPDANAETTARDAPDGVAAVAASVAGSLRAAALAGHASVQFDGHRTDPHWMPVLAQLGAEGEGYRLVELA